MVTKDTENLAPLFSVIIPTYNYADTLPRAIKSVLLQAGDDFDLLVVDDGSTDDTPDVVKEILDREGDVFRFIQKKNSGVAATRNYGIDKTKGKYLIFLDADDEMTPNALAHYRKHLKGDPTIGMLVGDHIARDSTGYEKEHRIISIPDEPKDRLVSYLLDKSFGLASSAVAISRDVFSTYRFPEKFRGSEDISMFAYILARFKVIPTNAHSAIMHKHDDSLRHNVTHAVAVGLSLVEEVFDQERIPEECQVLKKDFFSQRCLSLFRTLFLAGHYSEGRAFYYQAIRKKSSVLFHGSYLIKYLRSWF